MHAEPPNQADSNNDDPSMPNNSSSLENDYETQQKDNVAANRKERASRRETSLRRIGKLYLLKGLRSGPDRILELALTLGLFTVAAVQLFTTITNNHGTTGQTDQLISAAKISAYAASQSLQASRNFAESAHGINQGVSDAVDKLNLQATNTGNLRDEAKRSADEAEVSLHIDQRAWVGSISVKDESDKTGQIGVSFRIVNTGRTPALTFRGIEKIELSPNGEPSGFTADWDDASIPANASKTSISPGGIDDQIIYSPSAFDQLLAKKERFYFHGRRTYDDVFGRHHWAVFCFARYQEDPIQPNRVDWFACSSHNEIDKEAE